MPISKLSLFIILICLASCTFTKRLYNKGFYVSNHYSTKKAERGNDLDTSFFLVTKTIAETKKNNKYSTLLAQASKTIHQKNKCALQVNNSNCDTIVLKNGIKLMGTVTEIKSKAIVFKNCDSAAYYSSKINRDDVSYIGFANSKGLERDNRADESKKEGVSVVRILGTISLFLGLLCLILFFSVNFHNLGITLLFLLLALIYILIGFILGIISLFDVIANKKN